MTPPGSSDMARPIALQRKSQRSGNTAPDKVLHACELFGERQLLLIEHDGSTYRLRITQNNKLILTK